MLYVYFYVDWLRKLFPRFCPHFKYTAEISMKFRRCFWCFFMCFSLKVNNATKQKHDDCSASSIHNHFAKFNIFVAPFTACNCMLLIDWRPWGYKYESTFLFLKNRNIFFNRIIQFKKLCIKTKYLHMKINLNDSS